MSSIAFLGLGRMGVPMTANLIKAGHDVVVWNRTTTKAEQFASEHGCRHAETPQEAATGAEFVITMLADDQALEAAYQGAEGVLAGIPAGAVAIDMSTVAPRTVTTMVSAAAEAGVQFVDAPVSGSVAAATAATLTIMAAGARDAVDRARPVLESIGDPVFYLGSSGSGSTMKLAVNSIVHSLNASVSEALVLAERNGIAREQAYAVFLNSAISAPFVQYRQAAFERPDETPVTFRLTLAAKDLRLALEVAQASLTSMPQTEINLAVLTKAAEAGFGDHDESALAGYLRDHTLKESKP
jgi:3-hydroxyisobutyrate dehydrogenase-like beta-hydroxyacid dehydrogenase